MIKFFRHIRKSYLMEKNPTATKASAGAKTGKPALPAGRYFKYAIGEIFLVMIGILLALQVNNWNENRKAHNQEIELLTQLESEFKSNLIQLDNKIELRKDMISSSLKLLDYIDNPSTRNIDSIYSHIGLTILTPTFDPIVNDVTSSGRIQLLKNKDLKNKLSRWTSEIIQVTEEEVTWLKYQNRYYTTTLHKFSSLRTISNKYWQNNITDSFHLDEGTTTKFSVGNSKKEFEINELLDNSNFEDHMAFCATMAKITNSQSQSLRNRIVEILDLINEDLEK